MTPFYCGAARARRVHLAGLALAALLAAAGPAAAPAAAQGLPTVVVLATGGTIASVYDSATGGFRPALTGDQLLRAVPGLDTIARVEMIQVSNVSSTNITPSIWLDLAAKATEVLARREVAGVVVTHGTDTMEETAFFLDLTVGSEKPVVLVGAQRAASERDADGPRNLRDAILTALAPASRGLGTMVAFNGEIHAARDVTKTNTLNLDTFKSPEVGPLGFIFPDGVKYYRTPVRRQYLGLPAGATPPRVEIVPNYAGADGRLVRGIMSQGGMDGLVVEASGVGNLSGALFEALAEVRRAGIPLIVTSRVWTGRTFPLYTAPGSGVPLRDIGGVFADNLSAQKARVLLLVALMRKTPQAELAGVFGR